jgi:hypothetical protein
MMSQTGCSVTHHVLGEMPQQTTRAQCMAAMREPSTPLPSRVSQRARRRRGSALGSLGASPALALASGSPSLTSTELQSTRPSWPLAELRVATAVPLTPGSLASHSEHHCLCSVVLHPTSTLAQALGHRSVPPPWPWLPPVLLLNAPTWSRRSSAPPT